MSRMQRDKGARVERNIVSLHKACGVHAEKVPLSGAVKGIRAGQGHDIDVYVPTRHSPLCGEVKARKNGEGFKTIEDWLGENDFLVCKRNNAQPLVVLPFDIWLELCGGLKDV